MTRKYEGDIKFFLQDMQGQIAIDANDLSRDAGLQTAIWISLFSDQIVSVEENSKERRGWWGDSEDDKIGSKLWLLARSKLSSDTLLRANSYAKEALNWLITDGVAVKVVTTVSKGIGDVLIFNITVYRPLGKGGNSVFQFFYNWEAERVR
jgi:phage gp46-like protein